MTANVRPLSPHDAVSLRLGMSLYFTGQLQSVVSSSVRNFGGASGRSGDQSLHHFFCQVGKSDPHTRLSQTILSTERIEGETDQHSQTILTRKRTMGEVDLSLDQKSWDAFAKRANAIKPADLVAEAAEWAARLTNEAERKTGKTDTALETVARQTGVNQSTLWRLRYRKPKDLAVSVYMKLKTAWEAVQQRQFERMQHDLEVACLRGQSPDDVLVQRIAAAIESHPANPRNTINNGAAGE